MDLRALTLTLSRSRARSVCKLKYVCALALLSVCPDLNDCTTAGRLVLLQPQDATQRTCEWVSWRVRVWCWQHVLCKYLQTTCRRDWSPSSSLCSHHRCWCDSQFNAFASISLRTREVRPFVFCPSAHTQLFDANARVARWLFNKTLRAWNVRLCVYMCLLVRVHSPHTWLRFFFA